VRKEELRQMLGEVEKLAGWEFELRERRHYYRMWPKLPNLNLISTPHRLDDARVEGSSTGMHRDCQFIFHPQAWQFAKSRSNLRGARMGTSHCVIPVWGQHRNKDRKHFKQLAV
jgi:hypothetical protein